MNNKPFLVRVSQTIIYDMSNQVFYDYVPCDRENDIAILSMRVPNWITRRDGHWAFPEQVVSRDHATKVWEWMCASCVGPDLKA